MQTSTPQPGHCAPSAVVQSPEGGTVELESLWSVTQAGLALVFLRHFGCTFCRAHAEAIDRRREVLTGAGIAVALIGCGTTAEATDFRAAHGLSVPVYTDPERTAYAAFGLGEANASSLLHPKVLASGMRGLARGVVPKRSTGNPLQLQGQFLIDPQGIIRTASRPALMSEIPSVDDLLAAARPLTAIQ